MKLWGGRFSKSTEGLVDDFHSSITFDKRLAEQDITGSIAHATMLGEQKIIPQEDADKIVEGLKGILADVKAGKIEWMIDAEDIHMNVETILTQRIGEPGKRLHTGRSRNDQVALDARMYAKLACQETVAMLEDLLDALLEQLLSNLQLGMSVFFSGDVPSARRLRRRKHRFRILNRRYSHAHVDRLHQQNVQSIETSSLHLGLLGDMKRLNSLFCSVAYSVMEQPDEDDERDEY